ncbi:thioesterase domain-containing protein [Massilia sp. DJPM01]|uniref:thioesterase II family protein n=1 Tax=Massilia sp. DJPM01 TaxID=3024404 RepID=UPI00259E8362|nr:alpha/beta fold hydrolase [Massilia sp. DJPM01]MDM5177605.1 thioesterase domain-containing protein [Massilia sp. DJPM01]
MRAAPEHDFARPFTFSSSPMTHNAWFSSHLPMSSTRMRLVCLPHAGGGVAVFHPWKKDLPADIEMCPVQLPGRDSRYHEPLRTDALVMVEEIAEQLVRAPRAESLVIYGHSMGATLAYELARALGARALAPDLVIVSGRPAPQRQSGTGEALHTLPDAQFIEKLNERYGGVPQVLLDDPELMAFYLPILRNDLRLVETYRHHPGAAQDWPLIVYGGLEDRSVGRDGLAEWAAVTSGPFRLHMLPGDHFFYQTRRAAFLDRLATDLGQFRLNRR